MVDIHCHIIPMVDDGSKTFNETLKMARQAELVGINKIVATPHYIDKDTTISVESIKEYVKRLNVELNNNNINVEIFYGNEIFFTNDIMSLIINEKALPISDTKYILIEFPMYNAKPLNMVNEIENLIYSGYVPIIAHPERYSFTTKNYKDFIPLIEMGALMQINIGSISGTYGKHAKNNVKKLLRHNMVHLIGTDSHNSTRIYSMYNKCLKKIGRLIDAEKLYMILGNSDKVLKNEEVKKFNIKRGIFK